MDKSGALDGSPCFLLILRKVIGLLHKIFFYDSAQSYERFHQLHKATGTKNTVINIDVRLHLQFYFWSYDCTLNYDPDFNSNNCIFHD